MQYVCLDVCMLCVNMRARKQANGGEHLWLRTLEAGVIVVVYLVCINATDWQSFFSCFSRVILSLFKRCLTFYEANISQLYRDTNIYLRQSPLQLKANITKDCHDK